MTELPDKLRIVDGELICADGSDVREYLRQWAEDAKVDANTPVNITRRDGFTHIRNMAEALKHWGA